ncbi:UPF0236 family transposase-like protein [Spiroplasma endosymbiont of Dasysyrphus albostriatus]|uniref:UPF0236 family transposase-like protein n=1 Tax=Spiroplasma endosymbiont of Dasysyrphus albostriatus TaxID=3066299 RepID=UPI003BB222F6
MYKPNYYVHNRRLRRAITPYGKIIFTRRLYKQKYTGELFSFTDEYFGLQKNKNVTKSLKENIYKQLTTGKTIINIKNDFSLSKISNSTISRILSSENKYYFGNNKVKKNKIIR